MCENIKKNNENPTIRYIIFVEGNQNKFCLPEFILKKLFAPDKQDISKRWVFINFVIFVHHDYQC